MDRDLLGTLLNRTIDLCNKFKQAKRESLGVDEELLPKSF
jgi:hypothetical protein